MFDISGQTKISSCGEEYFITKFKRIFPLNCTLLKKEREARKDTNSHFHSCTKLVTVQICNVNMKIVCKCALACSVPEVAEGA